MPRLLLAAGGTGGHMFPAQSLAEYLVPKDWDVAMFTDARGMRHANAIPADPVMTIQAATLSPRQPIRAVTGMIKLSRGVREARRFVQGWKPDVVVGFGGYPAFPVMRAAQSLSVPYILHEQNAVLGRVNRIFAKDANCVATGFDDVARLPQGSHHVATGNPIRAQIRAAVPPAYRRPEEDIHLLVVGGSLGARLISETVPQAVALLPDALRSKVNVVQQTREESLEMAKACYAKAGIKAVCEPFFNNIETHLAKAHFVIGRAGASSVSEVAMMGKPALFVPLKIAMDDHQTANALTLLRRDAAKVLPESDFTPQTVAACLVDCLSDINWLEKAAIAARSAAKPDAVEQLAELVLAAV